MPAPMTISPDDLEKASRPVRIGTDLEEEDQRIALDCMAPAGIPDGIAARTWLATHVFVVTHYGRLDRHQRRPVARLEERA